METINQNNNFQSRVNAFTDEKAVIENDKLDTISVASDHASTPEDTDVERAETPPPPTGDDPNQQHERPIRITSTNNDKPYSTFTTREKILIVLCATMGGLFSPFTTNIYFPALDTIANDLGVTVSQVNLSITTYLIFQGISPTFISAITNTQGRRPTYIVGFIIYIAANIGLALNNSYAGLLVLRCVQSAGSSGMVTLQQAIIADTITSAERGKYIGITSITGITAPSVAPIIGGVLSQHLGWHSIFWFLLIMAGVYLVPMLLFMPETSRKIVDDGSILPPKWNMSLLNVWRNWRRKRQGNSGEAPPQRAQRMKLKAPNPMDTLRVLADRETAIIMMVMSITYAAWTGISSTITTQFAQIYHLDSTFQGLLFIPQAVGSIMSAITQSIVLDRNYRRHARKHGIDPGKKKQHNLIGFPIERVRLELVLPFFFANGLFTIAYGWLLDYEVHIAAPIVMLVFIGYTLMAGFNGLSVLNIDINRHRAAQASAAANLTRCLMGAGMTAVINPMINAMGRGWSFTLTGLVQIAFLPGLWICMKHGVEWRAKKAERAAANAANAEK